MNKSMRVLYVLGLFFLGVVQSIAQQNNTLFLMHHLPQSNIVNPSIPIDCKLYLGLPVLGSTHFNTYSTGFAFSDLVQTYNGDSLRFEPGDAIDGLKNREVIATEVHVSLITMGYKYKNNYFTFAINEKINTYNILPKNAILFAYKGNTQFEGESVYMDGLRVNANHYREYALGWAKEINEEFNFGIRVKFLFGKANTFTKPTGIRLYTHPTTFESNLTGLADVYTSFPIEMTTDEDGKLDEITLKDDIDWFDYAMNNQNRGYGVDLGFTYKLDDITTISGSLLDIGYIKWKTDTYHLQSSGSINITGTSFEEGLNSTTDISDSLKNVFTPSVFEDVYTSPLVPTLYLGIMRDMNEQVNIGAVFHSEIYKKRLHTSLTFSGNASLTNNIYGSVSYTLQNRQWNNIGLGVGVKMGFVHFHAISDNVPAFFNLTAARNVNLRFGISILTGCNKKQQIKAMPCVGDPYHAVQPTRRKRKRRK